MDEDDGFFDDDFGDLNSDTLLELEQHASATQPLESQQIQEQNLHQQRENQQTKSYKAWQGQSHSINPPARPPLQRHSTSTSFASAGGSGHRRPGLPGPLLSFAEADLQKFDAGTLDDGLAPVPAEQQDVVTLEQQAEVQQTDRHGTPMEPQWPDYHQPEFHPTENNRDYDSTEPYSVPNVIHDESRASELAAEAERLREQLEQLTRERSTMMHELNTAKSTVDTRAGEIAIIRANQAKQQQDHESQVAALRAAMAEQVRKHQAEIEATTMESKRVTTENAFLKQDLQVESFRANEEKASRARQRVNQSEDPVTPRKARNLPFRDGFDDDEIMASPSKSKGRRSGRGTPSQPSKRKRKAVDDSPRGSELQLSQSFENNDDGPASADLIPLDQQEDNGDATLRKAPSQREDRSVRFMRSILNHRTYPHKQRDLEVFASMSFPSQPDRTFSSYILESTASSHPSSNYSYGNSNNYAVSYAQAIISLWSRCILEKFYSPISMLMNITKFILNLDICLLAPPLIPDLVPVLRESAYVNGLARFRNSPNWHQNRGQAKQTPLRDLQPEVDGSEALEILYTIATSGCMDVNADVTTGRGVTAFADFWTRMRFDFILMMLNPYQPIRDIVLTLNLLSTSIQPRPVTATQSSSTTNPENNNHQNQNSPIINSHYIFGPLHSTTTDQTENENYILDRAANLLSASPSVDQGQRACTPREITGLRMEVMYFLTEVAFSSIPAAVARSVGGVGATEEEDNAAAAAGAGAGKRGGGGGGGLALLASHRRTLPCIFRSMHDELDALYAAHAEDERAMRAELVNGLTRLAYGVLHAPSSSSLASATENNEGQGGGGTPPPPQLNLHAVPGAVQKHLVVLTRLAFSERGVSDPNSQMSGASRNDHHHHHRDDDDDDDGDDNHLENGDGSGDGARGNVNVLLEAGIELETVEMAHEMLEEAVNPQEAEALVEVFRPGLVGVMEES